MPTGRLKVTYNQVAFYLKKGGVGGNKIDLWYNSDGLT